MGFPPRSLKVPRHEEGAALAGFLARHLGLSGKKAKVLLDQRVVFVNHQRIWMARHALRAGDQVEVRTPAAVPAHPALRTLYEDADYLVVDKPPGCPSNGPDSVEAELRRRLGAPDLCAVHRLDRDTSGCLLLARSRAAFEAMLPRFQAREVTKQYDVLAAGPVDPRVRELTGAVDGRPALTLIQVLDRNRKASYLRATIATGRTHQIRRHLADLRHPVLGDKTYATAAIEDPVLRAVPRQMLHASRLAVRHPVTGAPIEARAPLPNDFRDCLRALRLS